MITSRLRKVAHTSRIVVRAGLVVACRDRNQLMQNRSLRIIFKTNLIAVETIINPNKLLKVWPRTKKLLIE